jgi:hypothetical protein
MKVLNSFIHLVDCCLRGYQATWYNQVLRWAPFGQQGEWSATSKVTRTRILKRMCYNFNLGFCFLPHVDLLLRCPTID